MRIPGFNGVLVEMALTSAVAVELAGAEMGALTSYIQAPLTSTFPDEEVDSGLVGFVWSDE